jgi:CHAT domain-containing protein
VSRSISFLLCWLLGGAPLLTGSEPVAATAQSWQDSILLLIEDLRLNAAKQELQRVAPQAKSLSDQVRLANLQAELYCHQANWAGAATAQTELQTRLGNYAQEKNHDAAFHQGMQQQWHVRQALIMLRGRTASDFLQTDGPAPADEITGNLELLKDAAAQLDAALTIKAGLRTRNPLWEAQQRLWLTALQQRLAPQTDHSAAWRSILQLGMHSFVQVSALPVEFNNPRSPETQKQLASAAELCSWAVRQLPPREAEPLLATLAKVPEDFSADLKHRLLLVQADLLLWRNDREKPAAPTSSDREQASTLLLTAWDAGQANRSLTLLQTLDLSLRLSQTKALEQNLKKLEAWRQTLTQQLKTAYETQDPDWLHQHGRLLPVLEDLVQECRATAELAVAEHAAANLLRIKQLLEDPHGLQVADAHAIYAEFLTRSAAAPQRRAAISHYTSALTLWENVPKTARRELRMAETQNTLASLYLDSRQTDLAEHYLKLANVAFEKQKPAAASLAQWHNSSGYLQSLRGNYPAAREHYDQAQQRCKQALLSVENDQKLQKLYGTIALNQIQCAKQLPPPAANARDLPRDLPPQAPQQVLQLEHALQLCHQYLAPSEQLLLQETQATIRVWRAMFELERLAINPPNKQLPTTQRTAQFAAILQGLQPLLQNSAASQTAESAAAEYAAALCHYHLFLEQVSTDSTQALAQLRQALPACQRAYRYALEQETHERPQRVLELRTLQLIGKIYMQLAARRETDPQLLAAATMDAEQLARIEKLSLFLQTTPILQYQALETAARIQRHSKAARAPQVLDQALQAIESKRSFGLLSPDECARNFARFASNFDQLVNWHCEDAATLGQGEFEKAILVSDRKRSRTFLDQVRSLQRKDTEPASNRANVESRLRELQARLSETNARLLEQDDLAPDRYVEQLLPINREIDRLLAHALSTPTAEAAASSLTALLPLKRPTQVCFFHLGRSKSYLLHFVVSPGEPLKITAAPLQITKPQMARLKLQLPPPEPPKELGNTASAEALALNESLACVLTNALLEHWERAPQPGKAPRLEYDQRLAIAEVLLPETIRAAIRRQPAELLLWVPDGPLHRLPFEALTFGRDAEHREIYLLDDPAYPPSLYTPSLAIYHQLSRKPSVGFPASVLSLANPDYQQATSLSGKTLLALEDTQREQAELQALFPHTAAEAKHFFSLQEATEENFRHHAATAQVIHLGAHAEASEKHDQLEAVVYLTPAAAVPAAAANDGRLSLTELRSLSYAKCELAVLAACQTNVGQQVPLESGATIARAFLEKGASRVLCSQWKLADRATADLLCDFFSRLAKSANSPQNTPFYAAELQQAKRAIRAKYLEPHDWAPLILIGCE